MRETGLLNRLINKLPFELHLPGYNYCGPGTKLEARLQRGDKGINKLDEACRLHDIAYSKSANLKYRHKADNILLNMAKKRLNSQNASKGEKIASWLVSKIMKTKLKSGAGLKSFNKVVAKLRSKLKKIKPKNEKIAINFAYRAAKQLFRNSKKSCLPRVIPAPKTGGILPLIPIFAGLSALGSLAGGAAGIAKAVNNYKSAQKELEESKRHNKMMESIAIGKGLYVKPYGKGNGLFLRPAKN